MTDKYTPATADYIELKGKKYLPARRRVQWFRGEHPDWGITTSIVDLDFGAGYAVIRAEVTNETGRLIASGMKSETKAGFADFVEKAETGAIARAVAIAGYGTEDALDLDEGDRIADSPVEPRNKQPGPGERERSGRKALATTSDPAPTRYRRGDLQDLMVWHNLDIDAVEAIANRIGIPKRERPMSDASIDLLIAALEQPESSRAHADSGAGPAQAGRGGEAGSARASDSPSPSIEEVLAAGSASRGLQLEEVLAVTGGTVEQPSSEAADGGGLDETHPSSGPPPTTVEDAIARAEAKAKEKVRT
jgi:hypothetical protein